MKKIIINNWILKIPNNFKINLIKNILQMIRICKLLINNKINKIFRI